MQGSIAKENLIGFGAFEVQVGIVFPGKADAAMDLDCSASNAEVGITTDRLGGRCCNRLIVCAVSDGKGGIERC